MARKAHNRHHLIAKSRAKEGFNINEEENVINMRIKVHEALHGLFANKTPKAQIKEWLRLHEGILTPQAKYAIKRIAGMSDEEFYKPNLLKHD